MDGGTLRLLQTLLQSLEDESRETKESIGQGVLDHQSPEAFVEAQDAFGGEDGASSVEEAGVASRDGDDGEAIVEVVNESPRPLEDEAMEESLQWEESRVRQQLGGQGGEKFGKGRVHQFPSTLPPSLHVLANHGHRHEVRRG